jgi:hypothetical protein
MSFTPRNPVRPQTKVSPAKPLFSPRTVEKERQKRWPFQTCDKPAGTYTVPELKEQLGIDSGVWTNIIEKVYPLLEDSYPRWE